MLVFTMEMYKNQNFPFIRKMNSRFVYKYMHIVCIDYGFPHTFVRKRIYRNSWWSVKAFGGGFRIECSFDAIKLIGLIHEICREKERREKKNRA